MAKPMKVKKFVVSSPLDLSQLEELLNDCGTIEFVVATNGSILVIYTEK